MATLTDITLWKKGPENAKSVLFSETDEWHAKEVWLPKSEIEIDPPDTVVGKVTVTLPEWLAIERGLV